MALHPVDHPMIEDVLAELRDERTPPEHFRRLSSRLTTLLAFAASRDLPLREETVKGPLEDVTVRRLDAG